MEAAEDDACDEEGEGELADEEAEIHRLEQERASRAARFSAHLHASTQPASSSSSTSSSKLAVARAAGMVLPDDEEDDEDYTVNASTRIKGLCTTMCPTKELIDRIESHTISPLELPPNTPLPPLPSPSSIPFAIKKYRRAAAAQRLDPHDIRTPATLTSTCHHLIHHVVDRVDVEWHEVHRFVTDRFRAVRSDFVCQGGGGREAVECLEWMVRFHVLAFDVLAKEGKETFDPIQNMEKLTQTLTSLRLLYRDNAVSDAPFPTPHQAEMMAVLLFSNFHKNLLQSYTSLSPALQRSPPVQTAMAVYRAEREGNYARWFELWRKGGYLECCMMGREMGRVRGRGLEVLSRGYQRFGVKALQELMCMESEERVREMVEWYGMTVDDGRDEVVFVNGGKGGARQTWRSNEHGWYTDDRAQTLMDTKRPKTKREAILGTDRKEEAGGAEVMVEEKREPREVNVVTRERAMARSQVEQRSAPPLPPPSSTSSSFLPKPSPAVVAPPPVQSSPFTFQPRPPPAQPPPFFFQPPPQPAPFPSAAPLSRISPKPTASSTPPVLPPPITQRSPRGPSTSLPFTVTPSAFPTPFTAVTPTAPAATFTSPIRLLPTNDRPPPPPSSTSVLPLLRSLSSQQREERLQLEAEQQRQLAQQAADQQLTLTLMNTARQHFLSSLLHRWSSITRQRRQLRALHHHQQHQAVAMYRSSVLLTAFLHWHSSFKVREQRRVDEAEMRRSMSQGQFGLSAVHSGLGSTQDRLRQLLGHTVALPVTAAEDDVDMEEEKEEVKDAEEEEEATMNGHTPHSSLDVASLVHPILKERNPTYDALYYHVVVSVADEPSPFTDLLLHRLTATPPSRRPPLDIRFEQLVGETRAASPYTGCQGALFLLSSPLGVEDLPSLVSHPDPSTVDALIVPPASRFEEDRRRLASLLSSLHRQSHLPLVVLYPLSASSLSYLHLHGSPSSAPFQHHAAMMLASVLGLSSIDTGLVSEVSISPLFLPSHLYTASFVATSTSLFSGLNNECIASALTWLASSSPPYPILHRIDVPLTLEQALAPCLSYFQSLIAQLSSMMPALSASRSALPDVFLTFSPHLYIAHFNRVLHSFTKRLFLHLSSISWPPDGPSLSSPHSQHLQRLLHSLPLPPFPHSERGVLDWTWGDSYSAVLAYLGAYRPLEEEGEEGLGRDVWGLYHRAKELFVRRVRRVKVEEEGGVDEWVRRVECEERVERMRCWHEWMEQL